MDTLVSVDEARSRIMSRMGPPASEVVPLDRALGRTLLEEVVSKESVPPFKNSAMDGFAVRAAGLGPGGGVLRVVGEVRAGQWPAPLTAAECCIRIMTGAPMPEGADAVVPVEWTQMESADRVRVDRGLSPGRNVRPAGQDIAEGARVLSRGARIDPGVIAVLATLGFSRVGVGRLPTVSVVSTGDELVAVDEKPGRGQIRNSNGPSLAARVQEAGGVVARQIHARDNQQAVQSAIEEALQAEILVFSGGVSMGDYDLVKDVLVDMGLELDFWKVRQRPGKPLAFGVLQGRPVFGLPGNPVSAAICFEQYVRPALRRRQGCSSPYRQRLWAHLEHDLGKPAGLHVFARGVLVSAPSGRLSVRSAGEQGSNLSMSMVRANCVAHLPASWTSAPAEAMVEVELL
jgi:molybdopterin molybdotransferase